MPSAIPISIKMAANTRECKYNYHLKWGAKCAQDFSYEEEISDSHKNVLNEKVNCYSNT